MERCVVEHQMRSLGSCKDPTGKRVAQTVAYYRSRMDEYELHGHLSEQLFRAVGGYVANFSSSVSSISQEIYSQ
jgi:hypothetical protein